MAFKKPEKKEEGKPQKPQKGVPGKPFGQKGLTSPTYKRRNPHKDSGDKKPSLKTKASIIKEKAKKGQGLKRGGVAKALGAFPFIGRSVRQKGTISTIGALKPIPFIGKPLKKAMGGEASTSISRAELMMKNREKRRKETQEMLERLYGKKKIVPKKKPLKKKDGGEIKERIQKFKMKMNPQDFDLKTGARLTEKDKTDRMRRSRDKIKSKPKRKMF